MTVSFTIRNKWLAHGAHCSRGSAHRWQTSNDVSMWACACDSISHHSTHFPLVSPRAGWEDPVHSVSSDIDGNCINRNASHGFRWPRRRACRMCALLYFWRKTKSNEILFGSKRTLFLCSFTSFIIAISFGERRTTKIAMDSNSSSMHIHTSHPGTLLIAHCRLHNAQCHSIFDTLRCHCRFFLFSVGIGCRFCATAIISGAGAFQMP